MKCGSHRRSRRFLWLIPVVVLGYSASGCTAKPKPSPVESWSEQVRRVENEDEGEIYIENEPISDGQLRDAIHLSNLRSLRLHRGAITDEGLKTIANLPNLEELHLRESPITNAGAKTLTRFAALKIVNLPQSRIGDEGLKSLAQIVDLMMLRLGSDQGLSAAGLENLKKAKQLRFLHFINIPLQDDALVSLGEIETLESLYIDGASFSDEALSQLLKKRPGLHLHLDQRHHDSDPKAASHTH
jgi:hypothetical protein